MNDPDDDIDAALFVAGALTAQETAALKERLAHDPALMAKVREWEESLVPLGMIFGEERPPVDMLERIEARIDAREGLAATGWTLRDNEGEWIVIGPGVRFKELRRDTTLNRWTILVDAEAGAGFPAHEHPQEEEIYMISGDLAFGDVELGPGDYYFSPAGSLHAAHRTRGGCRCLIIQAM